MKQVSLLLSALSLAFFAFTAQAADASNGFDIKKLALGATYNFDLTGIDIHADYDLSDRFNGSPVFARAGYSSGTVADVGSTKVTFTSIYVSGNYDFVNTDFVKSLNMPKLHPYAGIGYVNVTGGGYASGAHASGLGLALGALYQVNDHIDAEVGILNGFEVGGRYRF